MYFDKSSLKKTKKKKKQKKKQHTTATTNKRILADDNFPAMLRIKPYIRSTFSRALIDFFHPAFRLQRTVWLQSNERLSAACLSATEKSYEYIVRKRARLRNRYNQAPQLTQDTNGKVTTSQLDITNESQEVSHFPACDHKASTKRRACKHNKRITTL